MTVLRYYHCRHCGETARQVWEPEMDPLRQCPNCNWWYSQRGPWRPITVYEDDDNGQ